MLVLTRKPGESVRIGSEVRVSVVASTGGQVRIAIEAPQEVGIFREEIFESVASANVEAAGMSENVIERVGSAKRRRNDHSGEASR